MGIVSSESKPDAFVGDGATVMLWVGPPLQDIFSYRQKALPLYFVFKVAHVYLPVFTKPYIWDAFFFFLNKIL